ncbi:MAG TPA: histidine kinase dimerization/phospho-acceptor domain-containing protein, partial [Trichocoleus sp.]
MSATLFAGSLLVGLAAGGLAGWRLGQRQSSPPPQTASSPENPSPPSRESAHQDNTLAYQRALALAQYQAGFLANTSHELRSPLNQVISLHQLIQADLCESPEEERLFLSQAQEATNRALQNLDLLTAISKLELGRTVPDLQPVQMTLLLTRFQRLIELQAANRNCRLKIALPSEDLYGLSDPHWLQQAMVLLVEGA